MRNFSPSALFALSLFLSCSALSLQAAVEGNSASNKPQASTAASAMGQPKPNTAPSDNATQPKMNPVQPKTTPAQPLAQQNKGSAPSVMATEAPPMPIPLNPETAQKPGPSPKPATPPAEAIANAETPASPTGAVKQPAPQSAKADAPAKEEKKSPPPPAPIAVKLDPFTGKITKNKVRIRLQPAFDGAVLREVNLNDLVVVMGESDDFYAIQPPADVKAYVYRTFVLDNVIEGNRVNARLKPDLESPVVIQLNSGDRVEGSIYAANNKWMEIKLPSSARFYIAKEYVTKAGDAGLKARLEKKHDEAFQLLNTTEGVAKAEMQKPFDQINLDGIKLNYEHLMKDYPEFPEAGSKAKEALAAILEAYTAKKVAYLENQTRTSATAVEANKKLAAELQAQKSKVNQLEQQIEKNRQMASVTQSSAQPSMPAKPDQLPINMAYWLPAEDSIMARWTEQTGKHSAKEFYEDQKKQAFTLKGIIDPYTRQVKNKPGDYMLLNSSSKLPIAFLYSTTTNLQDYVGHEVSIQVVPRINNNFAFPAYFVLQLE